MPRVPDSSDYTRQKKLVVTIAGDKFVDQTKFRVTLPTFNRHLSIKTILSNFTFPKNI
jgi:hypothetical protein